MLTQFPIILSYTYNSMPTTTLQPITIKFQYTEKFEIEDYIEWCEDQSITPSQKHYKEWAIGKMEISLSDDIDTNQFKLNLGKSVEVDYEIVEYEIEEEEPFSYDKFIFELTEEGMEYFEDLIEKDKMVLHPYYCKDNIIVMNSCDDQTVYYGVTHFDGQMNNIRISDNPYFLYTYLKNT